MDDPSSDDVLQFWFKDIEPVRWFKRDPEFDKELERRFGGILRLARNGALDHWCTTPRGCLALIIVIDQLSRNIFRGASKAFESDPKALRLTMDGMQKAFDQELTLEQRSFFYLPLRHAENLAMQKLGLLKTRELNAAGYGTDKYAVNHLELIERFGRFPHRNETLGRSNTPEEALYLSDGKAGF